MPIDGIVPAPIVSAVAIAAVSCVMFRLGFTVPLREYRLAWRHPGPMLRAIFASVVAVPAIAIVVARAFELPRSAVAAGTRNVGLAMLVASINPGLREVAATVVAYFFFAALALAPYLAWRRRVAAAAQNASLA